MTEEELNACVLESVGMLSWNKVKRAAHENTVKRQCHSVSVMALTKFLCILSILFLMPAIMLSTIAKGFLKKSMSCKDRQIKSCVSLQLPHVVELGNATMNFRQKYILHNKTHTKTTIKCHAKGQRNILFPSMLSISSHSYISAPQYNGHVHLKTTADWQRCWQCSQDQCSVRKGIVIKPGHFNNIIIILIMSFTQWILKSTLGNNLL